STLGCAEGKQFLHCELNRPPRRAADSSTPPAVIFPLVPASPADWRWRGGDVAKGGDRWRFLSDRDDRARSEWCAGRRQLRADAWRSSVEARGDTPSS